MVETIEVRILVLLLIAVLTTLGVNHSIGFDTANRTLLSGVVLALGSAIAAHWFSQSISVPLRRLSSQARAIASRARSQNADVTSINLAQGEHFTQHPLSDMASALHFLDAAFNQSTETLKHTLTVKERMESELAIGRQIQMNLLTLTFPSFPRRDNLDLYATLIPAREMSGDFYDFYFYREGKSYLLEANRLCFCVGDVSGKGVPAALFMAVTKILLKAQADKYASPATILSNVNRVLSADNPSCMFVTLFFGVLNLINGEMVYTNAGHNPPYRCRPDGSLEHLNTRHGPAMGVAEDFVYRESKTTLNANDMLVVFTDGVTEAMDPSQTLFSDQRLVNLLKTGVDCSAEEIIRVTTQAVSEFQSTAEQADDITLLSLKFLGMPEVSEGEQWERLIRKEILSSIRD